MVGECIRCRAGRQRLSHSTPPRARLRGLTLASSVTGKAAPGVASAAGRRTGALRSRARGLLSLCIFSALLALIPLTAIPYGTVDPLWEGLFECAIFSLAALWALEGALGGSWFEGSYGLLVPLLVLAAYMLLQTVPVPWAAADVAGVAASAT